jgi:hypothetical protein
MKIAPRKMEFGGEGDISGEIVGTKAKLRLHAYTSPADRTIGSIFKTFPTEAWSDSALLVSDVANQ